MKTIKDLTEVEWAKIHGYRAGVQNKTARYNPYILGFNDPDGSLGKIWENTRLSTYNKFLGI